MSELGVVWLTFGTYHSFWGFPHPKPPVPKASPNLVGWVKGGQGGTSPQSYGNIPVKHIKTCRKIYISTQKKPCPYSLELLASDSRVSEIVALTRLN